MPEKWVLKQYQALPLEAKVHMSQARIKEWYDHWQGDVYVSFSGGKDSTVLAHLVHEFYPSVPLLFVNTGLEFPEIQAFARSMGAQFVRPKLQFSEVISKYGYPIISKENAEAIYYARKIRNNSQNYISKKRDELSENKEKQSYKRLQMMNSHPSCVWKNDGMRKYLMATNGEPGSETKETHSSIYNKSKWLPLCRDTQFMISHMCCSVMKKSPANRYQKQTGCYPYIGTLTEESRLREQAWIRHGCNSFEGKKKTSQPMSFWTEQDVLHYIYQKNLDIASVYGDIVAVDKYGYEYEPIPGMDYTLKTTMCSRTGCIFCAFGCHLEKGETRFQRLAKTHPKQYEYCMRGGQWVDNPKYDPTAPKMDGEWQNWNPKKIWVPSKEGLGMQYVFDECNRIYGKDFIRYE